MSDLAKALKAAAPAKPGHRETAIEQIRRRMQDNDKAALAAFEEALVDVDRVSSRQLADLLTRNGYAISYGAIHNHRHRENLYAARAS